jgi:DNA-binding NarL/FixJ family response regulator
MPLRVFIVSEQPWARSGLREVFEGLADVDVVGEAQSIERVPESARPGIDVVILERDPGGELEWAANDLTARAGPGLVILGDPPSGLIPPTVRRGRAWASLSRNARADQIVAAARAVGAGLIAVQPDVGGLSTRPAVADDASSPLGEELTHREQQVLRLVALGLPNKSIGQRLAISDHTVKFHVASIMAKLGAASRTEAVHLAARRGLVAL